MSSTDSNLANKYQKIDVISDSPDVLKKSIKLCFINSELNKYGLLFLL